MLKSKFAVTVLTALLLFTSANVSVGGSVVVVPSAPRSSAAPVAVWLIFGCASGIIFAAAVANAQQNRQLTQREALTCGLLFWLESQQRRRR